MAGLGGTSKWFVILGEEKSSIPSFRMMPVCSDMNPAPKLADVSIGHTISIIEYNSDFTYKRLTVIVTATAIPSASMTDT